MAVVIETGTVTVPSSNGTVRVNLSKFDSSDPPKAFIFFGEPTTTAGSAARRSIYWCLGFSDGTTEGCTCAKARNNVGTTVTSRIQRWDAALAAVDTGASDTIVALGNVTEIGDDYFDVTFSSVSGGGQVFSWVALGGDDFLGKVVNWAEQEDDESSPKFVDTTFTPNALITTSGGILVATADDPEDDGFQTSLRVSHSFSVAAARYCVAWGDLNNNSNQQTTSYTVNVSGISQTHSGTNVTTNARMTATPTTGGFNVTLSNEQNTAAGSYRHTTLAIAGATVELLERTSPTSTGNEDISTGLEEVLGVLALGNGIPKGESQTAFGRAFFGAFDGTAQVCRGAGGTDGADPSNNYSWWFSDALIEDWFSGSDLNLSAAVSIVADTTIRLNWDSVAASARSFALLAIGPAPATGSVSLDAANTFGFQNTVTLPTVGMVVDVIDNRPNWPSLVNPISLLDLPSYVNDLGTDSPRSHLTGISLVEDYRFAGDDQTSDTRRPQGIALKDGILISQFYFRSTANLNKNKLILIDPAQGTRGRMRNIGLLAVNTTTSKFEAFAEKIGGIGVVGDYLYCAATESGTSRLRVFDLREFYPKTGNTSAIEPTDDLANTYDYFLPQVGEIHLDPPEGAGVGWMSATDTHFLLGNFYDPDNGFTLGGKTLVWNCEVFDNGDEFLIPGEYDQIEPKFPAGPNAGNTITRVQGGIIADNVLILSRSWSTTTQNLTAIHLDAPTTHFFCGTSETPQTLHDKNWLFGCEGVCFGENGDTFITITEFTNNRNVSEYDLSELLALVGDPGAPVLEVSNSFGFVEGATHNYFYEDCGNNFGFVTTNAGYDWTEDIVQYLGFTPRTVAPASNTFGFVSETHDVYALSASNTFNLTDLLRRVYVAVNQFGFSQFLVGLREEECFNVFEWAETLDTTGTEYGRDMEHKLLKQHLTFKITGARCADKEYAPLVGESGDDTYGEMPVSPPVLGSGTLTLTYPRVAPTHTLVLKNPEFGNSDTLGFTVIDELTRGGDRIVFSDPKWPKTQTLVLELTNVCDTTADEIIAFLNASLGQEIGLADWEGRNWKVVITQPNTTFTNAAGGLRVSIECQGEPV